MMPTTMAESTLSTSASSSGAGAGSGETTSPAERYFEQPPPPSRTGAFTRGFVPLPFLSSSKSGEGGRSPSSSSPPRASGGVPPPSSSSVRYETFPVREERTTAGGGGGGAMSAPITGRGMLVEISSCMAFAVLGHVSPRYVFRIPLTYRPIPYQITSTNDVILDLALNNEYLAGSAQTVPVWLGVVGGVLAIGTLLVGACCFNSGGRPAEALRDAHSAFCCLFVAFGSTSLLTESLKLYVGRLRPNFYEMCGFDADALDCVADGDGEDWRLTEARVSFPSAHSSLAFCVMTVVGLYLSGLVGLHRHRGHDDGPSASPWKKFHFLSALLGPLWLASFVAASRLKDNWHHLSDVLGGSVIGASCALIAHRLWYHSIFSPLAGVALYNVVIPPPPKESAASAAAGGAGAGEDDYYVSHHRGCRA